MGQGNHTLCANSTSTVQFMILGVGLVVGLYPGVPAMIVQIRSRGELDGERE